MEQKKYLIAMDLDGTLLPDYSTIDDKLKKIIPLLMNKGHKFVIVTGRPFRSSIFVYDALGLDTPLVNYNGCLITHPKDQDFKIINEPMKKESMLEIFNHCKDKIDNIFFEVEDHIYLWKE